MADSNVRVQLGPGMVPDILPPTVSLWRRLARRRLALVAALFLGLIACLAILAPWVTNGHPNTIDLAAMLQPPSAAHWMGTDNLGRDLYTRVLYGARISLAIGLSSMITASVVGTLFGLMSAYYGGWVDSVLMRLTDAMLALPILVVVFVLATTIGSSITALVLLISAFSWMPVARIVRSESLRVREAEYVTAARSLGANDPRIVVRHVLPQVMAPILVNATILTGNNIVLESVLSFLGFGVQPPQASWGNILAGAQAYVGTAPWLTIFPGAMIFLTVLSLNLIGDAFRDVFDPYMRGKS